MTALEQFNALNGTKAYRKDLENILQKAQDENNASLVYRISKTLNDFPDVNRFEIEIISYPEAPQGLSGAQHSGNYREALDDCGRLRKGWKFVKGNVVKIQKKEKPKKESKPKKETGPVKSKEENNSKKETKKDKKYKFVVITDDRHSRVIAVFSYTNPNIKDLRESFWKNGEGKYYETTEEGLRNYTFGMGVYPFEEAKKHIEEKYTEGKDFIYFIIEKDGGRDEAISLVEKPKKEIEPVKSKGEKASNFSLLQEPTKVLLKFSKDTNKEYYKKYTDEKGFVGVDFLKDNLKDLKKQAIIDEPQGFINTEDFEKSHKASKIKGIDSLKTIVSKDKLYPYLECVFIEPDTYVATDALKIVVLNRPKNDGLKTGAFYDPNFKCEKLGGCSKEEFYKDLERGFPNYKGVLFPKPKYFTEWIPLEPLIKHLKTGLEVLTKISGLKRVFTIAIKSNIEEKRFDIKNLLDVLLVLESNEAKKIRIEIFKELGNHPIQIKTDNNNLAVIMPLNPNSESSNVISPLKIAPIQLEFILNETEEKAPTKETGPVKAKEEKKEAEEKTSAKKELPRDFSEDLDYKSLYNSYSLISFDPERRAENDKKMFGASMLNLYNSSVEEAKENNRLEEYNQAFERYYAVILKKNKEVISARTGTFSTAVTGGAGIKANQIRKNEAKQKREYEINKELIDYIEKAEKKLNEVARNPDQFYKDQAIKRTDKNAIEKLNQKIELLEAEKDFIKRSEKACKEYQKTKDFSVFEKYNIPQKEAKEYVEQIERHGLPLIKGSSSINAEIRRVKERIALLEKSKESEDENFDIENGRILVNKEAQRVQIFFDNIPDANTRDALKKRAFKWAPSAKAWQRTLTGNAIDAVKYLIKDGVLVKKAPAKETGPVKSKEKKDEKTAKEIKKEDDLELTAEGRKALVERAMYYTRIRKKGRSYDEMYKNAKDLGEKHIDLIFNLSYLNPKGLMISDFIYDNVNKEECLKMVNWTGEARRLYPDLDNKYEDFFRDLRLQDFYKKETKEFFFKGIVDWHTKRTKRAAFLKSILDKYNIVLDYHSFNRFLIGINNNLYKNNYKELPDRDFYDFFFYLTDKLNNEFINDLKKHFVNTIEGKKIKKNAVAEEYSYKGELHKKGIEILRVVLKELEEAKGLSGVDYSQELFDDIGLNAPITEVSTERFKNMKVSELRAFTLDYYLSHLKGKKVAIKNHLKEVVFTTKAGRKIAKGEAMYSEKAAVIEHLEELIKNSTYNNWGDRKDSDGKDVLGYLNFKSKITIDGEKRHLRIAISVDNERNLKLKSYDIGKEKSELTHKGVKPSSGQVKSLSEGKDTKKSLSRKEKDENLGLNAPRHEGILKEALTEKGKLKKGWYFQDYGIIDPKGKYHPLEREFAYEYKIASDELSSRAFEQNEKRKQKGFEENIQIENNLKEFFKSLSQKNRKYFKSYKAVEIFYWAFGFEEKPTKFFTIEETNPYNEIQLKVFDKYFSNKNELFTRLENYETLRRYNLTNLGLNIITQIASFLNKEGKKVRGDVKKINEKYGLSMPFYVQEQEKKEIQPSSNSISNKIKAFQGRNFEIFNIENPDLSTFLGEIERKNIGSTVITLTGGAGSGKTRFAFQFMNALAQNYKVGHASLEEHPESKLYFDKVTQYLDSQAQNNISVLENETLDGLENLINENEVIVIDSFAKLREMDSKFLVDKDLRKKYNGKLFLVIFQQTSDGKMRGGSTSEFDGDIILFTKTFDDPKENFVYPSKNRYNALPLSELKYSVFYQQLLQDEEQQEQPVTDLIFDVVY